MAAINLSKIAAGTGSLEITAHGMADASALDMAGGRGITTSIVFIDSRLEDCETLVADVSADSEWLLVDSDSDGLAQMQAALAGRSDLASIRILAHGRPGALLLGASELTHDEVDHHAVSLAMIGRALDAQGDVQIYGCEVGQGDTGCAFVDALAEAIGAPVAASSSPMGHAELGGGWWLDVGEARSPVLDRPQWRGLLGVTITPLAPSYPGRSAGEVRNGYAFAAVRADGSVVTWGHSTNGGNSSAVTAGLDGTIDVTQVFSTMSAFAALRANGSVVTWGNSTNGGDSSAVAAALD
ncbi:MAG: DUF4347 domain-containing protein, partial [Candidatus Accumulibacter sp.]|nr:DUF4347 domain-containing protein [Accumulibacter sp.]